jgi:hypothetical protein
MQQIREISTLTEDRSERTALSTRTEEQKRSQILQQLVCLQMGRKEAMGERELVLYARGLERFSIAALKRVVGHLCTTKRAEYEPKIPELGDLIDMVRVEARKDNPIAPCNLCNGSRWVIGEREGGDQFAKRCECWIRWKQRETAPPAE